MDTAPERYPHRGAQARPTAPERRELVRTLKPLALAGDVGAAAALATFELADELRRQRLVSSTTQPRPTVLR